MSIAPNREALNAARDHYVSVAETWVQAFKVEHRGACGLSGRALITSRIVHAPLPANTRRRLYILAHEIGHIALGHTNKLPRYVEEYEAESFAHVLLRRFHISVPRASTDNAKRYVRRKIAQALKRGLSALDPVIAEWAGAVTDRSVPAVSFSESTLARVENAITDHLSDITFTP